MFKTNPDTEEWDAAIREGLLDHGGQIETMNYLQSMHEAWVQRQPKEDPMLKIIQQNIAEIEALILFLKHALFFSLFVLLSAMYIGG